MYAKVAVLFILVLAGTLAQNAYGPGRRPVGSSSSINSGSGTSSSSSGNGSGLGTDASGSNNVGGSSGNVGSLQFVKSSGNQGFLGTGSGSGSGNQGFLGTGSGSGSGNQGFLGIGSGSGSGNQAFVVTGSGSSSGNQFVGAGASGSFLGQNFGNFPGLEAITLTDTRTVDHYTTVTDLVFNSVPVTVTGLSVDTVTLTSVGVHQTGIDDLVFLRTTVVVRPTTELVTTSRTMFKYVTQVSIDVYTITHSAYLIHQTTHTEFAQQTLTISSPVIRTEIRTSVKTFTDHQTIVNTVFVHGYN